MKRVFLIALILLLSVSLLGCIGEDKNEGQPSPTDEEAVVSLVEHFSRELQAVSLQAPKDMVEQSMQEKYSDFVSPALLAQWLSNPLDAPGRLTSSPWPDRIEVFGVVKMSESAYEVTGDIVEITSTETVNAEAAARRPITLVVKKSGDHWLIDAVTLGAYQEIASIIYESTQYSFSFSLPVSWQGYWIVNDQWEGAKEGETVETGPLLIIRHPQWTEQDQRQDIPILVFTHTQWNSMLGGAFHLGAAPMDPGELGRNSEYVLALPARYNYRFPTGYEEVERILQNNPLQAN